MTDHTTVATAMTDPLDDPYSPESLLASRLDHLDSLDRHVQELKDGKTTPGVYGVMSTGEWLYIAVASSHVEMLTDGGYTIARALNRLGPDWTSELLRRWG